MSNKSNRPTRVILRRSEKRIPTSLDWHPCHEDETVLSMLLIVRTWTKKEGEKIWGKVRFCGTDDTESETFFDFDSEDQALAWFDGASKWQSSIGLVTSYNIDKQCPGVNGPTHNPEWS